MEIEKENSKLRVMNINSNIEIFGHNDGVNHYAYLAFHRHDTFRDIIKIGMAEDGFFLQTSNFSELSLDPYQIILPILRTKSKAGKLKELSKIKIKNPSLTSLSERIYNIQPFFVMGDYTNPNKNNPTPAIFYSSIDSKNILRVKIIQNHLYGNLLSSYLTPMTFQRIISQGRFKIPDSKYSILKV